MEIVKMYKSLNGNLYESEEECKRRDYIYDMEQKYEDNKLFGDYNSAVDFDDIVTWIKENKDFISEVLNG